MSLPGGAKLLSIFDDTLDFISGMLEWQDLQHGNEDVLQDPQQCPSELRELLQGICLFFETHTTTPVVLASGFQGLVHKLAATMHAYMLGRAGVAQLCAFLDTFFAWTTDLGVEFGYADFKVQSIESLLPPWWRTAGPDVSDVAEGEPAPDDEECDVEQTQSELPVDELLDGESVDMAAVTRFVFRFAMAIPGTLHVIALLCKNMHAAVPGWDDLWSRLKMFEKLLVKKGRRQRYINTCINGVIQPTAAQLHALTSFSKALYDKRWGCVLGFIGDLMPLLPLLRRTWSEAKYSMNVDSHAAAGKEEEEEEDGKFDPAAITASLWMPWFGLKLALLLRLQGVAQALANWAELCPCHGGCIFGLSRRAVTNYFSVFLNFLCKSCPLAGRRAVEMAAGKIFERFEELAERTLTELLQSESASFATPADIAELQLIFNSCKNYLFLFLKLKFDFWSKPPYIFCALGHWDASIARRCAKQGFDLFLQRPFRAVHHRITWIICHIYRKDLEAFIEGTPLAQLSFGFRLVVAKLFFILIVERSIEARHALVQMALYDSGLKGSTVNISFSNRLPEWRLRLQQDPSLMEKLVRAFEEARQHSAVPALLGLEMHPIFHDCVRAHHTRYTKALRAVLYRADMWSPVQSYTEQQKDHERSRSAAEQAAEDIMKDGEPSAPKPPLTLAAVQKRAMLGHLRATVDTSVIYSLPAADYVRASIEACQGRCLHGRLHLLPHHNSQAVELTKACAFISSCSREVQCR